MYQFTRFIICFFHCFSDFLSRDYIVGENKFIRRRKMTFEEYVVYAFQASGSSNYADALRYFTNTLKNDLDLITPQAVNKQRMFISPKLYEDVYKKYIDKLYGEYRGFSKLGEFIIAGCDGSIFHIPNSILTKIVFDIPIFNIFKRFLSRARVSCILDVNSTLILSAKIVSRNIDEITLAIEHLKDLNSRMDISKLLTLYDRGYGSTKLMIYNLYYGSNFVIRLNSRAFSRKINNMGSNDGIIQINVTKKILRSISDANVREFADKMGRLEIRIVKVELKNGTIEILATNLDSSKYNGAYLKEIYGKRWAIETGYDKLKNLIRIEDFTGIRRELIEQDFYAGIFMYNICSTIKFDIETTNMPVPKNTNKKYKITANFSSIVTLIYNYIYKLFVTRNDIKITILNFIYDTCNKRKSYNEINPDVDRKIEKPDYDTRHSGFKKNARI